MQYQVPQFIEVEDKIFGDVLTFKQFIYVAGGMGISFLLWIFIPKFFAILLIIPIMGFAGLLAFYKLNGKPFIFTVENAVTYWFAGKLYIWKKEQSKKSTRKKNKEDSDVESLYVPKLSDSKLKDIAWSLDVHKKIQ